MSKSSEAALVLRLIDEVSGPGRAIAASLGAVNKTVNTFTSAAMAPARALTDMGRNFRRHANDMIGVSASMSLGITKAASNLVELERQLNVGFAAGDLSLKQRKQFMGEVVALNADYAATNAEIAGAANELLKSGFNFDQSMGALPGVLDTAQAMGEPLEAASKAVVDSMVALRMEMKNTDQAMKSSKRLADLYVLAVNETTASLDDFATSGKYFSPVAASMGMSPEESFALQMALAKNGIKGSSAGTGLRSAPVRIAAPSKKAKAAMARLGIDPREFVGGEPAM